MILRRKEAEAIKALHDKVMAIVDEEVAKNRFKTHCSKNYKPRCKIEY